MSETITLPDGIDPEALQKFLNYTAKNIKEDPPTIFKEWEAGKDLLRVYRGTYKGKEQFSIRKFFQDDPEGPWKFGKGVNFTYEDIDNIIEGLNEMKEWGGEHPQEE